MSLAWKDRGWGLLLNSVIRYAFCVIIVLSITFIIMIIVIVVVVVVPAII